ncbi:MAG: hypothetical protein ACOY0T_20650 [Myxococcota bacterium]
MEPPAQPPPSAEVRPAPLRKTADGLPWSRWLGRMTVGLGAAIPTPQRSMLQLEGYDAPRWVLALEAGPYISEHVVLAAFALTSLRSDDSKYGGPTLREDVYAFGLSLPLVVELRVDAIALFTPRLGVGFGSQSFGGKRDYDVGPAFGVDACVLLQRAHFGFGLGLWSLRVPSQGAAEANDYGALMLQLGLGVGK